MSAETIGVREYVVVTNHVLRGCIGRLVYKHNTTMFQVLLPKIEDEKDIAFYKAHPFWAMDETCYTKYRGNLSELELKICLSRL